MQFKKIKIILLSIFTLSISSIKIFASDITLNEILNSMEKNYKITTTIDTMIENTNMIKSPDENEWVPQQKMVVHFRRFNEKIDVNCKRYNITESSQEIISDSRSIWEGNRWLEYTSSYVIKPSSIATVSWKKIQPQNFLTAGPQGSELDGLLCKDLKPCFEILRDSKEIKIYDEKDRIGNSSCYVIESHNENGNYKLWIDANDYIIKKALVHKEGNNIYANNPLSSKVPGLPSGLIYKKPIAIDFELNGIETEKVGNYSIASKGFSVITLQYSDGTKLTEKNEIKRHDINLYVNFEGTDAFKMEMPIGTQVWDTDVESICYIWNGHDRPLTAWVDQSFLDVLDKEVKQIKSEPTSNKPMAETVKQTTVKECNIVEVNEIKQNLNDLPPVGNKQPNYGVIAAIIGAAIGIITGSLIVYKNRRRQ